MKFRNITFLFFVFLISLIFKPDKHLDLFRYYESARSFNSMNYTQVVMSSINDHGDFLYFLFLKIFTSLDIPVQFVTAIFATLFYWGSLLILQDNYRNGHYSLRSKVLAERAIFLTVPIHLILSISRMTCSFSFLFLAIHLFNKRKFIWAIVLSALALSVHTATVLFLGLFLIIEVVLYLVKSISKTSSKKVAIYMILGGVMIVYMFSFLSEFLGQIQFFLDRSYYLKYVEEIHYASYRENGFITFFTMITYIILNAFYAYNSNLNEKSFYCICLSCLVPIFFFLGNVFSMRACMFSIPFFSVCLMGSYNSSRVKGLYEMISIFTTILFILVLVAFNRLYI